MSFSGGFNFCFGLECGSSISNLINTYEECSWMFGIELKCGYITAGLSTNIINIVRIETGKYETHTLQ